MTGATLGVAILGAVYDLMQGGARGVQGAMVFGGLVQIGSAALAWRSQTRRTSAASIETDP